MKSSRRDDDRRLHAPAERAPTLRELALATALLAAAAAAVSAFEPSPDRCGIRRVPVAEAQTWRRPPAQPYILDGFTSNVGFANRTSREALLSAYGDARVSLTSSNSFSEGESEMTLSEYLHYEATTTTANESYYLFGPAPGLRALVDAYAFPPCGGAWCAPGDLAASFGVAGGGSGVSFHTHGSGFGEVLRGRKRWILYAPGRAPPGHHPDLSTRAWVDDVLPTLAGGRRPRHDCVLGPAELLYFPPQYWHATLNLDAHTVFVSSFASDSAAEADAAWTPSLA